LRRFGIDATSFRDARGEIYPNSDIPEIGWSSTLNNLNAAVALSQLNTLSDRIGRTRATAASLASALGGLHRMRLVQPIPGAISAYWGFLLLTEHRDAMFEHLKAHGIKSSTFHQRNDWYTGFGTPRAYLPGTELVMDRLLALPCGYWLTDAQISELILQVSRFNAL
jgi:dTDP-4-amino-4,6-dideoxygalactose transaminase